MSRPHLLFYVSHGGDPQRFAVAPALGAAALRAGWRFDCYYDAFRRGRHFGGGDLERARPGWPAGSLVAGGQHAQQVLWLGARYHLVALGDPASLLWPALEAAAAEILARSVDPAELYAAAFGRLGEQLPSRVIVVDGEPQGGNGLVAAPYTYPAFCSHDAALGMEVGGGRVLQEALVRLGAEEFRGLYVDPVRAAALSSAFDSRDGEVEAKTYAELTTELAARHACWGEGVLLGDPDLVAAHVPKAFRLRLLPLYGRPQTEALGLAADFVRKAREPVYGRQYDDRDFFALGRLGRSFQLVDPGPPFDAAHREPEPTDGSPQTPEPPEPSDDQLEEWAAESRVLATVLFWAGMIRELDCLPRVFDLAATTGLRAGLVLTTEAIAHADPSTLALLTVPVARGGVFGLVEPLLASAGRGVGAESVMPREIFATSLAGARREAIARLPPGVAPRGWWPLLDAPLVASRDRAIGWRSGRLVVRFPPRSEGEPGRVSGAGDRRDARALARKAVDRLGLQRVFEPKRPFDGRRPGAIDEGVAESVLDAGFTYMWTKTAFGRPAIPFRRGDFVALSLTAGSWEGWSPFYTVAGSRDLARAERQLLRSKRAGWLAATVDTPLFALSGEALEHGARIYAIGELLTRGGKSGRLVNATPHVLARYARLLGEQARTRGS